VCPLDGAAVRLSDGPPSEGTEARFIYRLLGNTSRHRGVLTTLGLAHDGNT
jgi:hypothetical protein